MKTKTIWTLVAIAALAAAGIIASCVGPGEQDGFAYVEDMTDGDYQIFRLELQTITQLAVRPLLKEGSVSQEDILLVAEIMRGLAEEQVINPLSEILKEVIPDETLADALLLVQLELRRYKAFGELGEDGLLILTERSKDLLVAIAQTLEGLCQ